MAEYVAGRDAYSIRGPEALGAGRVAPRVGGLPSFDVGPMSAEEYK